MDAAGAQRVKARPAVVDCVAFRGGELLLVLRRKEPGAGKWALPGGFMEFGESAQEAASRECLEETAVPVRAGRLVGVYSSPARDPRQTVAIAFLCEPEAGTEPRGGDDAAEARWWNVSSLPPLAFDHEKIVFDALKVAGADG
jgi:8-oxo-dGTP diphosphatase